MGNFSRDTFDALKHYVGVRLQQGVPIVDADWNELEDIRRYELRTFLRWFVGNGVPHGNDGFAIFAVAETNDFGIRGGDGTPEGAGRCLVEGWEVANESDIRFTQQPLFNDAALAAEWGVDPVQPLTTPASNRNDLVYLDVWEREVDSTEDPDHLVNPAIGVETAVRLKREWAVRVVEGTTTLPAAPDGHVFYALAGLSRTGGNPAIPAATITDHRQTGLTLAEHLTDTSNPHQTTAAEVGAPVSVDGVSNPGGDIDLDSANAITLSPNNAANRITIGENHSGQTNNPHGTTAAQVGALSTSGGNVTGEAINLVTARNTRSDGRPALRGIANTSGGFSFTSAAIVGLSTIEGLRGISARAPSGTHALHVTGSVFFSEGKGGYVVDSFINASGQSLKTGDLVKLTGSPVARFHGSNNKIPIAEVTLADRDEDNMVIGIVDREGIPDPDSPDARTNPEDPTTIADGGELFAVTLGAYAHCKADATSASIEVGDLLTSSANAGHVKKATEPKLGSIIGKALEPLKEGTGYIAVFVNIQ